MSYADEETSRMLAELQKRIEEVYDMAWSEVSKEASDYFAIFKDRYEEQYKAYEEGKYTKEQFEAWYLAQVGRGKRWEHLRDQLAADLTRANEIAAAYINDTTPGIYSLNANYTAWEIYNSTGVDFALVDANTIRELMFENKIMLPPSRVPIAKSEEWNAMKLTQAVTSGIIRGKSIGKMADEFQRVTDMDRTSALRNARTYTTSAQNAGRQETYNRAAEMGIVLEKEWIATEDARTRDSHAELDGVRVKPGELFPNGLEFPGDRRGRPEEVYNCRCTVRAVLPEYETELRASEIEGHEGEHTAESYKEWEDRKREERMNNSKPYTHADATARALDEKDNKRYSALMLKSDDIRKLEDVMNEMSDNEREVWTDILSGDVFNYHEVDNFRGFYEAGKDEIHIMSGDSIQTVMHEASHRADYRVGSVKYENRIYRTISDALEAEISIKEKELDLSNFYSIIGCKKDSDDEAYVSALIKWVTENKAGDSVTDVISLITKDRGNISIVLSGHPKKEIEDDPTMVNSELWANYCSMTALRDKRSIELINMLIPYESKKLNYLYNEVFLK